MSAGPREFAEMLEDSVKVMSTREQERTDRVAFRLYDGEARPYPEDRRDPRAEVYEARLEGTGEAFGKEVELWSVERTLETGSRQVDLTLKDTSGYSEEGLAARLAAEYRTERDRLEEVGRDVRDPSTY
ncbi:MAG: hypothetical protein ABEJ62_02145 [Candidatus Nanohaloarchaea archaeon]